MVDSLISVIIPVYNVRDYLERCIDSVINNTYKNLEIICIDDGSPDDSLDILKRYEKSDSRVKVISKKNGGLSSARNAGLRKANGSYIAFIDSDDWIHPNYFRILIDELKCNKSDIAICGFDKVNNYTNNYIKYTKEQINNNSWTISLSDIFHDKKYKMHKVYSCGVLYKKEIITYEFPEGVKVIEDNIFNILNLPNCKRIQIVNLPLYFYFFNDESIMHSFKCEDAFRGLHWLCDMLNTFNISDDLTKIEIIEFIYKRSLFYRYAFTSIEKNLDAIKETAICYKSAKLYDSCLPLVKRIIYRLCMKIPVFYYLYKWMSGDIIDKRGLFSLAEGKML